MTLHFQNYKMVYGFCERYKYDGKACGPFLQKSDKGIKGSYLHFMVHTMRITTKEKSLECSWFMCGKIYKCGRIPYVFKRLILFAAGNGMITRRNDAGNGMITL